MHSTTPKGDGTRLGRELRYLRSKAKLTLEKVGSKAQVCPQYLSRIERGHRVPSLATLEKLAKAYNWNLVVTFTEK